MRILSRRHLLATAGALLLSAALAPAALGSHQQGAGSPMSRSPRTAI